MNIVIIIIIIIIRTQPTYEMTPGSNLSQNKTNK